MRNKLIPIVIVVVAILTMVAMMKMKPEVPRKAVHKEQPAVSVYIVKDEVPQVVVKGFGIVNAKEKITVVPMVTGLVVEKLSSFEDGGVFRKGDVLLKIEEADYMFAVQSAEAMVAKAELGLARANQEAEIAKREWNQLSTNNKKDKPNPLVLHAPQLKMATADLEAAKAQLGKAKLNLDRCKIVAPFSGRVMEENADVGQYLRAGNPVGVIHSIAEAEVVIPLDDGYLQFLDIPICSGHDNASSAEIIADFAGKEYSWKGEVARTSGGVDNKSRRVDVILSVENPYHSTESKPSLMEGMFVEAVIYGHSIEGAVEIPREALKDGNCWIVENSKVVVREVEVLHFENETAIVRGLVVGEKIVTSHLEVVTDGIEIKIVGEM
jgi:RND family efflux transporter MFP subunit